MRVARFSEKSRNGSFSVSFSTDYLGALRKYLDFATYVLRKSIIVAEIIYFPRFLVRRTVPLMAASKMADARFSL